MLVAVQVASGLVACGRWTASGNPPPTGRAEASVSANALPLPPPIATCKLPAHFEDVGLGFPRIATRMPATGTVRVPVIFVDFSDAVATRAPQSVLPALSPATEQFYAAQSYGRMRIVYEPSYVWRRMSRPSTGYGWEELTFAELKTYLQEAIDLAGADIDWATAGAVLVVANPDGGALANGATMAARGTDGVMAGGRLMQNALASGRDIHPDWANHEFGHALGLVDLYRSTNIGGGSPYVGAWSQMGIGKGPARELFAWERWVLGWVNDDQVHCASAAGRRSTVTLSPVERVGGTKMIVAPVGFTTAVVVESRRNEGFDRPGFTPGVVVYTVDTEAKTSYGPLRLLPVNDFDEVKPNVALQPGQSMEVGSVKISFVSRSAHGDVVRIWR
jgi:M6 family metalloprotease-like protein